MVARVLIAVLALVTQVAANCDLSCGTLSPTTQAEQYERCVSECEKAAMEAAAKYGGLATSPPCYDDIMACGLTADPKSAEAAQTMGSDVLGCMFMQMATKKLAASCQAAVDAVGTEELMKCMTAATDLCGMPSLDSSSDAVAAQVACLSTNVNAIKASDATCGKLVDDLISLEQLAVASAPYSR